MSGLCSMTTSLSSLASVRPGYTALALRRRCSQGGWRRSGRSGDGESRVWRSTASCMWTPEQYSTNRFVRSSHPTTMNCYMLRIKKTLSYGLNGLLMVKSNPLPSAPDPHTWCRNSASFCSVKIENIRNNVAEVTAVGSLVMPLCAPEKTPPALSGKRLTATHRFQRLNDL